MSTTYTTHGEGPATVVDLDITGMTCASCAARVEKNFSKLSSFTEDMIARGRVPHSAWLSRTEGLVTPEEQRAMEGLGALPQAFVDRLYYQTPVDTENRDKVYDGLLKSNITKEQADATIAVIDAIAHHYAEVTGQTPEAFYDLELTDYRVGKFDEFNVDQERQAAQTRTQFQGGIPTDVDGNELVDMDGTPIPLNSDGTITLYHRTSKENADYIIIHVKILKATEIFRYNLFFTAK